MLIPLEDCVLVLPIEEKEEVTASGFIIEKDKLDSSAMTRATVISVGPGKVLDDGTRGAMDVAAGDIVYFNNYSPDEIEVDGEKHFFIRHSSILAIEKN